MRDQTQCKITPHGVLRHDPVRQLLVFFVLIVLITQYFQYRKSMAKLDSKVSDINDNSIQRELDNVKQRLAVLEKIVTDKSYDLHDELSKFRQP